MPEINRANQTEEVRLLGNAGKLPPWNLAGLELRLLPLRSRLP